MWFAQYGETKSKSREAHLDCQHISAACFYDASPIEDACCSLPKRLRRVVLLALRALRAVGHVPCVSARRVGVVTCISPISHGLVSVVVLRCK